jgi:hypothetical protein
MEATILFWSLFGFVGLGVEIRDVAGHAPDNDPGWTPPAQLASATRQNRCHELPDPGDGWTSPAELNKMVRARRISGRR